MPRLSAADSATAEQRLRTIPVRRTASATSSASGIQVGDHVARLAKRLMLQGPFLPPDKRINRHDRSPEEALSASRVAEI